MKEDLKRMILHIDGDSFFASVEISLNPKLKGLPVVTGQERGIATAMSKEAKALGVHRGMPVFQIRKLYPQVIIAKSDYMNYSMFAQRMYDIVRRYTPELEEYSIDECFGLLTASNSPKMPPEKEFEAIALSIKKSLQNELGMTFSLGLAPTKVLAKVASKWQKPDGFTTIYPDTINNFLNETPVGAIWGIGPQTSAYLQKLGVKTAKDFIDRSEDWVKATVTKPHVQIWHELRGTTVFEVHTQPEDDYKSIQKTRTFTPPTTDRNILFSQLSKNVEAACAKLRLNNLSSKRIYYFLKTQEFRYHRKEMSLSASTNTPADILNEIKKTFDEIHRPGIVYRATGITMSELTDANHIQTDLFGLFKTNDNWKIVYEAIDNIDNRYGTRSVILGSSLNANKHNVTNQKTVNLLHNPITGTRKRLRLPYMGEVI